jgi:formamidopyrimidine-DNA glycosylase
MPELPEVETVVRGLRPRLVGRRLVKVETRRRDLRIPFSPRMAERMTGRRVEAIDRRAKYILMRLDKGETVLAHLGMAGRMTVRLRPNDPPGPHDHVVMTTDDGWELRFNDVRRFGLMILVPDAALPRHALLAGLGPEPLSEAFDAAAFEAAIAGRRTSIKAALLDQKTVAGIGNIYASEALFRAGVSPKRLALRCKGERAARIVAGIKSVLGDAIAAGGSSLRDYVQADGELGYFQQRWTVYDRAGRKCPGCRCKGAIRRIVQSNRATYYCPVRQT